MANYSGFKKTKTISFTSGKGGVGKTTMAANFAHYLALQGKKVLVFDGDLGMANVDIFFGVKPNGTLLEVIQGEKDLMDVITPVSSHIHLVSGGSGLVEMTRLNAFERKGTVDAISQLEHNYDYMVIDTSPGISDNVLYLNSAAQNITVIVTPDPASITDSYALMKVLYKEYKETRFTVLCNQVRDDAEGLSLFQRLADVTSRFLPIGLDYGGSVTSDPLFRRSTQSQRLILKHETNSDAARVLNNSFNRIEKSLAKSDNKGGIQFFWEQVVGVA
jgi:flagellar biosynthesis protein FlhG